MGGFSVQCDCGKWFSHTGRKGYKDHCKAKGCLFHETRVGPKPEFLEEKKDGNQS